MDNLSKANEQPGGRSSLGCKAPPKEKRRAPQHLPEPGALPNWGLRQDLSAQRHSVRQHAHLVDRKDLFVFLGRRYPAGRQRVFFGKETQHVRGVPNSQSVLQTHPFLQATNWGPCAFHNIQRGFPLETCPHIQ